MAKPVCAVVGIGPKNGAAFARKFAAEGYAVALLARSTQTSASLAEELPDAAAFACDVSDADAVSRAFADVREQLGDIDVLVYNAGSGSWGNIEEVDAAAFEQAWRVNSLGLFNTSQQVIPAMKKRGSGSIVVVGATASLRGKPFTTVFAPAKAAQRSLAQAMARHLGPSGVHVSLLILDGGVGTPDNPAEPATLAPEDIAHSAHFVATQPRSAWTFELDLRPSQENW